MPARTYDPSAASSPTSDDFASARGNTARESTTSRLSLLSYYNTGMASSHLLDPPAGVAFADFVRTWSDEHVLQWLADNKCESHAPSFRANDIHGDVILDLDQQALKEMGINSVGDRIKIISAVKSLRQKCIRAPATPKVLLNGGGFNINGAANSAPAGGVRQEDTNLHRGGNKGRPPPLRLVEPTRDIRAIGPPSSTMPPDSARTPRPGMQPPKPTSSTNPAGNQSHIPTDRLRQTLPPLPPGQAPQAPNPNLTRPSGNTLNVASNVSIGRRTPTEPPTYPLPAPPANQTPPSAASSPWKGVYGLPSHPTDKRRPSSPLPNPGRPGTFGRSNVASPIVNQHQKTGSVSANRPPPSSQTVIRPATSNTTTSPSQHPYAAANSTPPQTFGFTPMSDTFRTSIADNSPPIGQSPPQPSSLSKSGFGSTRPGIVAPKSLDELRRTSLKFHLNDSSRTVNVGDCEGGVEVLERALKKMNLMSKGDLEETPDGGLVVDGWGAYMEGRDKPLTEAELLAICHADVDNPSRANGLTLRRVGQKHTRKQESATKLASFFGEDPPAPGEKTSPTSPTYVIGPHHRSIPYNEDDEEDHVLPIHQSANANNGFLNPNFASAGKRATAIHILANATSPPASPSAPARSPTSSSIMNTGKKLRGFFGQRPPSELITSHLPEFFPLTEKKVLERTARHSIMRSRKRESRGSNGKGSDGSSWAQSRFSTSTMGSARPRHSISPPRTSFSSSINEKQSPTKNDSLRPRLSIDEPPRMSVSTDDGRSFDISSMDDTEPDSAVPMSSASIAPTSSSQLLLPPVSFGSDSLSDSLAPLTASINKRASTSSKRYSYLTELRNKRDRSDTASMLTLDEITAEVESRRASLVLERTGENGPEQEEPVIIEAEDARSVIDEEDEEDELEDEEDQDEEDEEDEEEDPEDENEDEDEDEEGGHKAVTSSGDKRSIKWIKGALIGQGSFGSVYLGMDAFHGVLMAVKQVKIPTGTSQNEDRKQSMLSALEREIELLKELQHEHIVQYLDSSIDKNNLNIFLEYVPGGSITALLRNYGAFEEALVKNWVKQILQGLNYLHERNIIHRDIKGANILVDNKGGIKISDFGISKKVADNLLASRRQSLQGSVFWMAPEVVKQAPYTNKADIWSLGCLIVEMLTGEHPWAKLTQMQAIFKIGSLAKPQVPSDITPQLEDFLSKTFELDHNARPSAAELMLHPWLTKDT